MFNHLNEIECKECIYKCRSCELQPENCLVCSSDTRENAPTCNCKDTYFDDGNDSEECEKCVHPCVNCTNLTQCLTCVVGVQR